MKAWIWALCLAFYLPYGLKAQSFDSSSKAYFLVAKTHLENMLDGKEDLSYEDAIFHIENAWYDGSLDYTAYKKIIRAHVANIQNMMELFKDSSSMNPVFDPFSPIPHQQRITNYQKALANYAIFKYMTDTTFLLRINDTNFRIHHSSFDYAYTDPLGTNDWSTTQVSHLLIQRKGNCFALASLFKILSDRLNSDASLNTAPSHIYISHLDDKGARYNVELSTRTFPGAGTIGTLTHSPTEALKKGIALRALDKKQSVALCLVYLAKGYEYKYGIKDDDFSLACAQSALSYDSLNLNAMLLKAEVLESRLLSQGKDLAALQKQQDFKTYQSWITHIYNLGYREMPYEMKNLLVQNWTRDSTLSASTSNHSPDRLDHPFFKDTRYASLSWGKFDEEIVTKPLERYGNTVFDTKTQQIVSFVTDDVLYTQYNFDPVVFAMSIDPLAHKYPSLSPYTFVADNPLLYIDPDGREIRLTFEGTNTKELYLNKVNQSLGGFYEAKTVYVIDNGVLTGKIILTKTDKVGEMSQRQKAFYNEYNRAVNDQTIIRQTVVQNDNMTLVGSYLTGKLDISDINAIDNAKGSGGGTGAGAIIHETIEQLEKAKLGLLPNEWSNIVGPDKMSPEFVSSHKAANEAENKVNGNIRDDQNDYFIENDGSKTRQIITEQKDGSIEVKNQKVKK